MTVHLSQGEQQPEDPSSIQLTVFTENSHADEEEVVQDSDPEEGLLGVDNETYGPLPSQVQDFRRMFTAPTDDTRAFWKDIGFSPNEDLDTSAQSQNPQTPKKSIPSRNFLRIRPASAPGKSHMRSPITPTRRGVRKLLASVANTPDKASTTETDTASEATPGLADSIRSNLTAIDVSQQVIKEQMESISRMSAEIRGSMAELEGAHKRQQKQFTRGRSEVKKTRMDKEMLKMKIRKMEGTFNRLKDVLQ